VRREFADFTVPQYAVLTMAVLAVVVLAFWFMQWSTSTTWEVVASGMSPGQVQDATDELDGAGVEYQLANGGSAIQVPSNRSADARVALGDLVSSAGSIEGYEILDRQGFMASSFRQRIDYQRAVEGELARTITAMETVSSATVHLAIPEDRLFSEDKNLVRASVVVSGALGQSTVAAIANVVASAVPGLDAANVTVADAAGRILTGRGDAEVSDMQLEMQELYEMQLEAAAESMLAVALGPGRSVVRVTAKLDFDELESETVTYSTDEQALLRTQRLDEAFTGDRSVPLGTLGSAEDVTDAGELAGDEGSAYIRQEESTEYGVPSTRTVTRQAPGSVERLTVAVLVDQSIDPAPDPEALAPLIAAAVGIDQARGDTIVVDTLPFGDTETDTDTTGVPALAGAAVDSGGLDQMLDYAKTGVAVLAIVLVLLILYKGLTNLRFEAADEPAELVTAEARAAAALRSAGGDEAALPAGGQPASRKSQDSPLSDTSVDMLDLIDSQPDEVANLLRDLMSDTVS
jgi:flagellar M-ring protein FliF